MAGGETYREFDNASIITSADATVVFGRYKLRKRDLLLGGVAVLALIVVVILAIVLAVEVDKNRRQETPVVAPLVQATTLSPGDNVTVSTEVPIQPCDTVPCLKAAVYAKTNLNQSEDPCDDFYAFACGGYAAANPSTPDLSYLTPTTKILADNVGKILAFLDYPVERVTAHSYERKLKHFIQSCNNHFEKMNLGGTPFINKVLKPIGGWYVLDNWNASSFTLSKQLKQVHVDFWTAAFFSVAVRYNNNNWNKRVVELSYGGLGLDLQYYSTDGSMVSEILEMYQAYMGSLATLVTEDAGVHDDTVQERVSIFVEDAFEVENVIANFLLNSQVQWGPHNPENLRTLGDLTANCNNTIDFVAYMKAQFSDAPELFNSTTQVAITTRGYFLFLCPVIANYSSSPEGRRKLHNYLVWQLISKYAADLSWDYVHYTRVIKHIITGVADTSSGSNNCIYMVAQAMPEALDAIFVKQYVRMEDKQEGEKILSKIVDQMVTAILNARWMTQEIRDMSIKKIKESVYKIGFPDFMVNDTYLDSLYASANISDDDYFGNVLSLNLVSRKKMNNLIKYMGSRSAWSYHVYDPQVEYINVWQELIATASILQSPLFDYDGPDYYNFGTIGTLLARNLVHGVDENGGSYKLDGSGFGVWWDNNTISRYFKVQQCAVDAQRDQRAGPYVINGKTYWLNISMAAEGNAAEMLADASGLSMSYKAYKLVEKERGRELLPAGIHKYTADQLFFVAYAQVYCQSAPDIVLLAQRLLDKYPLKNKINLAMSHVPEFQSAFKCQPGHRMHVNTTCTLF